MLAWQARNTMTAARSPTVCRASDRVANGIMVFDRGVVGFGVEEEAQRPVAVPVEEDHVAIGRALPLAEAQEAREHVGPRRVQVGGVLQDAQLRAIEPGLDAAPQRMRVGGDGLEAPRLGRRLGQHAAEDAARVLEVDLGGHAHLAEVGGVAERLQFFLGRGVEGIAGPLVVGDGVGQHGPGLSLNGSGIHRRGLSCPGMLLPGQQGDRGIAGRLERVAREREAERLAEQVGRHRAPSPPSRPARPAARTTSRARRPGARRRAARTPR